MPTKALLAQRTWPMAFLRRYSRASQAKGSSLTLPSRLPCSRRGKFVCHRLRHKRTRVMRRIDAAAYQARRDERAERYALLGRDDARLANAGDHQRVRRDHLADNAFKPRHFDAATAALQLFQSNNCSMCRYVKKRRRKKAVGHANGRFVSHVPRFFCSTSVCMQALIYQTCF